MNEFDTNARIVFAEEPASSENPQEQVCDRCGTSLYNIQKDGIVGCINCYKIFADEIKKMIASKQGTIEHVGIIPSKHFSKVKIKEKIIELEEQKRLALLEENYVSAESIKNQIEKLKGEL